MSQDAEQRIWTTLRGANAGTSDRADASIGYVPINLQGAGQPNAAAFSTCSTYFL